MPGSRRRSRTALFIATITVALAGPANVLAAIIDKVWVGDYDHSFNNPVGYRESGTQEIEVEADSAQFQALRVLGAPRIAVTMAFNSGGKTDFGGAALAWDHRLHGPLFWSLQFGLNGNDGYTRPSSGSADDALRRERLMLGSNVLFREAAGLNWRLKGRWEFGVQYIHESNGQILARGPNESLNELGFRLGYRLR
jgi:hypothetical protein